MRFYYRCGGVSCGSQTDYCIADTNKVGIPYSECNTELDLFVCIRSFTFPTVSQFFKINTTVSKANGLKYMWEIIFMNIC